jgi:dihydrofolate reductase
MNISIYIATSANGLISNNRNVPDWLSPEYGGGFFKICQQKKAVIMGKKTYDILAPDNLPLKDDGISLVLTSNTAIEPPNPTVIFTNDTPKEIVSLLEEKGFSEAVIIGGAIAISEFVNAGLVNEIIMVVEPVLFATGGLTLLKDVGLDYKLKLVDSTKLNNDTVQLHYQIVQSPE